MDRLDCGDSSCEFTVDKRGMRTNGGCRCLRRLEEHTNDVDGWVYPKSSMRKVMREYKFLRKELFELRKQVKDQKPGPNRAEYDDN